MAQPDELHEAFREMWADDTLSTTDIMERLGVTDSWVTYNRRKLGLPPRSSGTNKVAHAEQCAEDILRLHEQGLTPKYIAAKLDKVGEQGVRGVLARRGIEPHKGKPGGTNLGTYTPSPEVIAKRLSEDCVSTCAKCGDSWSGTLAQTRKAFKSHACAVAVAV